MTQPSRKMFGRELSMRSTFCKYDPDVSGPKNTVHPENWMVSLISDRFLGEKFTKNILSKKFKNTRELFTYNLIADTIGCNLNCWFSIKGDEHAEKHCILCRWYMEQSEPR